MKKIKKIVLPLLILMLFFSQTAVASEKLDMSRKTSVTVHAVYNKTAVEGLEFQLYLVSTMNEDGTLTVEKTFKDLEKNLQISGKNDDLWKNALQKIQQKILKNQDLKPEVSAKSDREGIAYFENLKKGLYFVVPCSFTEKGSVYSTSSFFVLLPDASNENKEWDYTVDVSAKIEKKALYEDYTVLKIWKDRDHEDQRPKKIVVNLFCDGKLYNTVELPQNGRWQYTWSDLETTHQWTVTEEKVKGYETSGIVLEGNTFTITNTCLQDKSTTSKKLPQTGQLWWPVPMLLCGGFLALIIGLLHGKGQDDES